MLSEACRNACDFLFKIDFFDSFWTILAPEWLPFVPSTQHVQFHLLRNDDAIPRMRSAFPRTLLPACLGRLFRHYPCQPRPRSGTRHRASSRHWPCNRTNTTKDDQPTWRCAMMSTMSALRWQPVPLGVTGHALQYSS